MVGNTIPLWRKAIKSVTPPVVWRVAATAIHALAGQSDSPSDSAERDAHYYNDMYSESVEYRIHYTVSQYYFLWCVLVDRLKRANVKSVLDIGCGAGQIGSLLRDAGIPDYCGIDLSESAIKMAQAICHEYTFVATSVFDTDLLEKMDYDTVISLEFLEHVNEDVAVLRRIRQGKRFYGSVPNFPYESHVRHFQNSEEVTERYGSLFTQFKVDTLLANEQGKRFFLIEGVRA
jgi:SAM-dependent methyltransferase